MDLVQVMRTQKRAVNAKLGIRLENELSSGAASVFFEEERKESKSTFNKQFLIFSSDKNANHI